MRRDANGDWLEANVLAPVMDVNAITCDLYRKFAAHTLVLNRRILRGTGQCHFS